MGKYDPLRDYLIKCGNDEVTLSFADIESILGRALPPSASNYDAWWANITARSRSTAMPNRGIQPDTRRRPIVQQKQYIFIGSL